MRALYKLAGRWSLWSGAIGGSVLIVWAAPILGLFGPDFVVGAPVLMVLAASRLASTSTGMCGRMLAVTGKARLVMLNMGLMVGINLVLDLIWIPRHGAMGAATATLLAIATSNLVQSLEVWLLYRVHPWTGRSLLGVLAVAALAGLAWTVRDGWGGSAGWLLPLALFVAVSATLYALWDLGAEDRALLRSLRRRLGR
jgi:O-antigen/teichoic acid export membrane protein